MSGIMRPLETGAFLYNPVYVFMTVHIGDAYIVMQYKYRKEIRQMYIMNDNQPELATAYVPFQEYTRTFEPMEALQKGTIFPDLYQPYDPEKGWRW